MRGYGRCHDDILGLSECVKGILPLLECNVRSVWMQWESMAVVRM